MEEENIIYYKGEKHYLIEEMNALVSKIKTLNGVTTKVVETRHIKTVEQYEKEFNEKPFGRHDVWIN